MSEHILRILLDELVTVRIICAACKSVAEVNLDKLAQTRGQLTCRFCDHVLQPPKEEYLRDLAAAMKRVVGANDLSSVEFVIKDARS